MNLFSRLDEILGKEGEPFRPIDWHRLIRQAYNRLSIISRWALTVSNINGRQLNQVKAVPCKPIGHSELILDPFPGIVRF